MVSTLQPSFQKSDGEKYDSYIFKITTHTAYFTSYHYDIILHSSLMIEY